jgi:cytochrome c553
MHTIVRAAAIVAAFTLGAAHFLAAPADPPAWAYPVNSPGTAAAAPAPEDASAKRVPGSAVSLTLTQTRDAFDVPDWRPNDHPPMPDVVAHGRKPGVRACGYCHLPNGFGRPENSSLAGLPARYIVQQMADYKEGLRKSAEPRMGPPAAMLAVANAATDDEVRIAAEYFASVPWRPWIRVVETDSVPRTRVAGSMFVPVDDGGIEPIGRRIVEVPEDRARTELRDAGSGFVAYVPAGSVKRGEALVTTGGDGKTIRCGICHGDDLRGLGPVPGIAGRSPSYAVRQLYDMQQGVRRGLGSALMRATVAKLTEDDMIAIGAYTASRLP